MPGLTEAKVWLASGQKFPPWKIWGRGAISYAHAIFKL